MQLNSLFAMVAATAFAHTTLAAMYENCKCQDGSVQWDDITEAACLKYFQADHLLPNSKSRCGEFYPYYAGDRSHQCNAWSACIDEDDFSAFCTEAARELGNPWHGTFCWN
ncbi:hypothetical protein PV10_06006 [Exophiala mesophila]|uniref:Extracellular membrane protein CFEM domain-containing protein n=1 Tax=Exophiala mesophila TaxID=212818 RepID=A0A0D1WQV5_EXOME|nr:uncharacterized protein PV10_06006 [Exophiala mesophila]KIV91470.1 hypothetical protein PV10_06006 [Exophiala mesophila]